MLSRDARVSTTYRVLISEGRQLRLLPVIVGPLYLCR